MHWYGGSMVEAVNLSKQRNAIFVVFIEGENDLSTELATTIENQMVVTKLSNESDFLAVKLKSGSENYTHFAKIYQFVPVPSLFFIGRNGTPLEVVCAGVEPQNLADRIDRILDQHYKEKHIQPSTSGQNIREQTANLLQAEAATTLPATAHQQPSKPEKPVDVVKPAKPNIAEEPAKPTEPAKPVASVSFAESGSSAEPGTSEPPSKVAKLEHHEVTKSGQEYDVVCDGDVCVRRPKSPSQPGPSKESDSAPAVLAESADATPPGTVSMEEKLEHAKEVIDARRREKAEKEKQLEKEREKERRETGQGVAELKRWQADQEMKQIQEERKRERRENELARQRILQQIAQDRAERRARDQPAPAPASAPAYNEHAATGGDAAARVRVQFKLPDGAAHTAHFPAAAPLADLRAYIAHNLQLAPTAFSLWTSFPRRELTETDATLQELQLAPSAALLVMTRRAPAAVDKPSKFSEILQLISHFFSILVLDPTYAMYSWFRERLFPRARDTPAPSPGTPPGSPGPAPDGGAGALRRRGNVHRLAGERPGDDDNNTWNGNSTQQM